MTVFYVNVGISLAHKCQGQGPDKASQIRKIKNNFCKKNDIKELPNTPKMRNELAQIVRIEVSTVRSGLKHSVDTAVYTA